MGKVNIITEGLKEHLRDICIAFYQGNTLAAVISKICKIYGRGIMSIK